MNPSAVEAEPWTAVADAVRGTAAEGRPATVTVQPRRSAPLSPVPPLDWRRPTDTGLAVLLLSGILLAVHAPALPGGVAEFLSLRITIKNFLVVAAFALYWQACLTATGAYSGDGRAPAGLVAARLAVGCTLGSLGVLVLVLTGQVHAPAGLLVPGFWVGAVASTIGVRTVARAGARARRARSAVCRVALIGSGPRAAAMWGELRNDRLCRYELIGLFDTERAEPHSAFADRAVEPLGALERTLMHTVVDQVVIALPVRSCYAEIEQAICVCERAGVQSRIPADVFRPTFAQPRFEHSGGVPVLAMHVVQSDWRVVVKRIVDLVGALTGILLLLPLFIGIAIAVKLSSPGPVFFAQERYGLHKRRFRMLKFRTMVPDAEQRQAELEGRNEAAGPVFKIKDDPRVTRVGRFLRRTSLDELPQLWNVVRGDMSLVGPRPLPLRDVGRFDEPWLMRRFSVHPGITGLWQISGRSGLGFNEWIRLDLQYIDHWSLALDARIIVRTFPAVFKGVGAS